MKLITELHLVVDNVYSIAYFAYILLIWLTGMVLKHRSNFNMRVYEGHINSYILIRTSVNKIKSIVTVILQIQHDNLLPNLTLGLMYEFLGKSIWYNFDLNATIRKMKYKGS